jgi:hypothetical protein
MSIEDFFPAPTDWRFRNSSGGELSVGLGEFLSVGGAIGDLYVKEGDGLLINLQYVGLKGGIGVGMSLLGPLSAAFSPASFEGEGIGQIYRGPAAGKDLTLNEMLGPFYMVTFGLNAAPAGFGVSVVFMGLPVPVFGTAMRTMLLLAKAAGVVWGISGSTSGGIEANATTGTILAAYSGGLQVAGN